jgi:hypothetical protein
MSLATWAEARPWARAIRHEVMTRRMPIWHAARGYGDFANDPSLSPFEIALVTAWVDGGAPRSFVPRGSPAIRLPGPPEAPLIPMENPPAPPSSAAVREVVVPCGDSQAPAGRLLGLRPELAEHGSARVTAALTNGRAESLGWFRDFARDFVTTYWLRAPLTLGSGSRIQATTPATAPRLIETIGRQRALPNRAGLRSRLARGAHRRSSATLGAVTHSDVRRILTALWLLGAAVALYVYFFHREALEDLLSGAATTSLSRRQRGVPGARMPARLHVRAGDVTRAPRASCSSSRCRSSC